MGKKSHLSQGPEFNQLMPASVHNGNAVWHYVRTLMTSDLSRSMKRQTGRSALEFWKVWNWIWTAAIKGDWQLHVKEAVVGQCSGRSLFTKADQWYWEDADLKVLPVNVSFWTSWIWMIGTARFPQSIESCLLSSWCWTSALTASGSWLPTCELLSAYLVRHMWLQQTAAVNTNVPVKFPRSASRNFSWSTIVLYSIFRI